MCPARDLETVRADPVEVGPDNELDKLVYIYIYIYISVTVVSKSYLLVLNIFYC